MYGTEKCCFYWFIIFRGIIPSTNLPNLPFLCLYSSPSPPPALPGVGLSHSPRKSTTTSAAHRLELADRGRAGGWRSFSSRHLVTLRAALLSFSSPSNHPPTTTTIPTPLPRAQIGKLFFIFKPALSTIVDLVECYVLCVGLVLAIGSSSLHSLLREKLSGIASLSPRSLEDHTGEAL